MTADQETSKLGLGLRSRGETRHEREKNRREEEIKPRRDEKAPVPARGRAREAERTALEGSETGSNDRRRDRAAVRKKREEKSAPAIVGDRKRGTAAALLAVEMGSAEMGSGGKGRQ